MRFGSLIAAFVIAASAPAAFAQVVTENAGTISPETPVWKSTFEVSRFEDAVDIRVTETFLWAPNPRLDFALAVPFVRRDLDLPVGLDDAFSGIGDLSLRAKQVLHKTDDIMRSTRFSALAGVEFPTGPWHEEAGGVDIDRTLQIGAGSFGFFGGPLFTHIADRHRFAFEAIGHFNLESDGFRHQPYLRIGGAYFHRLSPAVLEVAGERTEVRGVAELTHILYGESRDRGSGLGDDGALTMLSLGVQVYPAGSVLFEAAVQIPLHQTNEDLRGDREIGVLFSIKVLF